MPTEAERRAVGQAVEDAIRTFSSPTVGRGDVHGGQVGFIVYEREIPFIIDAVIGRSMAQTEEVVAAAREFLAAVSLLCNWMNGNDLVADHADAKPEDYARLCAAMERMQAALGFADDDSEPRAAQ